MAAAPFQSTRPPRSILVRGVNWLGDAVMTTPALSRLREKFPEAHIALLTPAKLAELYIGHPAINEIIAFAPEESLFTVAGKLRAKKFDAALIFPNSPRSALQPWLAGIPTRVGFRHPWRNFFLTLALPRRPGIMAMRKRTVAEVRKLVAERPQKSSNGDNALPVDPAGHQIHEYLHLAAAMGANPEPLRPSLHVRPAKTAEICNRFGLDKVTGSLLGLNPGAEYGPAKRWPVENFIATAREIQSQTRCTCLLFGGKNDAAITAQIASALAPHQPVIDLAGKTGLGELMQLLKQCRALLTNDTGPMHLAAAVGTPVVALFGSTSPALTGPGLPGAPGQWILRSDPPCSPCFLRECPIDFRCLRDIPVETAVAAIVQAFAYE